MNCFELQSHFSDYLDGTLSQTASKIIHDEVDQHLKTCSACADKNKHFQVLITSIASQGRIQMPDELRKAPFSNLTPEELMKSSPAQAVRVGQRQGFGPGFGRLNRIHAFWKQTFWRRIPWYLRTAIEGSGIVLLVLIGISAGPRLRKIYERSIERSVSEFNDTFNDPSNMAESSINLPLTRQLSKEASAGNAEEFQDEAAQNDAEDSSEDEEADDVRAGSSEIWRFNVKTDSPHEFRAKVVQTLSDLGVPKDTAGLGGIEAPGGIQFDILVNASVVPNLKRLLQKAAPRAPEGMQESPVGETFSWFKNKSRRKIPPGKTRVVIWLSQM